MMHTKAKFLEIFKETLSRSPFYVGDRLNKAAFCGETVQKKRQSADAELAFFLRKKIYVEKLSEVLRAALFFASTIAQRCQATCEAIHAKPSDAGGKVTNTANGQGNPGF